MDAPVRHVAFDPHSGTSMKGKGAGGSSSERFPYFLAIASESGNSPVAIALAALCFMLSLVKASMGGLECTALKKL